MIAIRADIDGLLMPENNQKLPYKSQTKYAHMCGHDGHVAMLMAATEIVMKNLNKIPSNKTVRLLWQPAEEGPGGAMPMIKEGCLNDVDEVYGLHNVPNWDEGDIRVVAGPIMAAAVIVKIKVKGKGGCGSAPHEVKDPIVAAARLYNALHTIKSRSICNRADCVFTICHFETGEKFDSFPDEAFMEGTIRSYDWPTQERIIQRIECICDNTAKAMECEVEYDIER